MVQNQTDTSLGTATGATSGSMGSMGSERAASSHGGVTKGTDTGSSHAPASKDALRAYGYTGDTGYERGDATLPPDDSAPTWADVKAQTRRSSTGRSGRAAAIKDSLTTAQEQTWEQIRLHPWLALAASFALGLALTTLYRSRSRHQDRSHAQHHLYSRQDS